MDMQLKSIRDETAGIELNLQGNVRELLKGGSLVEDKIEQLHTETDAQKQKVIAQQHNLRNFDERMNAIERKLFTS